MSDKQQVEVSFASPLVIIHQQPPPPPLVAWFTLQVGDFTFKGASMPATGQAQGQKSSANMPAGSLGTLSVAWKDTGGNPAKVDGPTTWTSTDATIVQVTVATGNPLIANVYAPGPTGSCEVHANADADMGSGVTPVTAIIAFTVISGQAVAGEITFAQGGQGPPSPGGPQAKAGQAPPARK